jgi:hypothetical protein
LIRSVCRLEAGAAKRRAVGRVGLVWSCDESLVLGGLGPGELVARDVYFLEGGGAALGPWVRVVERLTADVADLGFVYGPGGELLGRVVELDGSMITWRPAVASESSPAASGAAVPPPDAPA